MQFFHLYFLLLYRSLNDVVVRCVAEEVFYGCMVRSWSFGESVSLPMTFSGISQFSPS